MALNSISKREDIKKRIYVQRKNFIVLLPSIIIRLRRKQCCGYGDRENCLEENSLINKKTGAGAS